ncbi:uncharacterized protein LOC127871987 [Dreissena polymorpha]|uniref:CARD domain-containing protein n=1 Tax=Dreissena polymorpha TaxID=45954 RepID=A0A9D4LKX6_DREPO|nr:uncharacterized protein LOC127871987 [Dreissena polymorpha]KAH3859774.1 hypothetical protein DPMN_102597 [Dreissena polymorpha]
MNELQRSVLQKHTMDLVRDMIVTEHLTGLMFSKGIFEAEMIEMIKAGSTHSEKAHKLLELLPKRGPDAFELFLDILHDLYPWLEKLLQDSLTSESERILACQLVKEDSKTDLLQTPRTISATAKTDEDIKIRVSAFVQKQFGQIRRISNSDKKAIEVHMSRWLHQERKRLNKLVDDEITESKQGSILHHKDVKQHIHTLHCLIRNKHLKKLPWMKHAFREEGQKIEREGTHVEVHEVEVTLDEVTFDHLRKDINEILHKMDYMQGQISRSYDYIDGNRGTKKADKDISVLVHELCGEYRYKEKELVNERQKIEKMLVELYNFSAKSNKLQNVISGQEHEINALKEHISNLNNQNNALVKEIAVLEQAQKVHREKEKTLAELKQAKNDLHTMIEVVNKENKELKELMEKKGLNRNGSPRRALNNISSNNSRFSPRKQAPKRKSNSFRT